MAKTFFKRNDPAVIKDAQSLTEQQFIDKYFPTTYSTQELLSSVWKLNQPVAPQTAGKEVTFKVIPTDKKENKKAAGVKKVPPAEGIKPREVLADEKLEDVMTKEIAANFGNIEDIPFEELGGDLSPEELAELALLEDTVQEGEPITGTLETVDTIAQGTQLQVPGEPVLPPVAQQSTNEPSVGTTKRNRGRQPLANADKRDARILELVKEGKLTGKEIVTQMKEEGFSVHAPQVTAIKQRWENEKEEQAASGK